MNASDWLQLVTAGVLLLTLLAVLWYAYETRKTRLEMERGRLDAARPIIEVAKRGSSSRSVHVGLCNIGKSTAFNVRCHVNHPSFTKPEKEIRLLSLPVEHSESRDISADPGAPELQAGDIEAIEIGAEYADQYGTLWFSRWAGGKLEPVGKLETGRLKRRDQ